MNKKDLISLKKILSQKRTELLNKISSVHREMDTNSYSGVGDEVDAASRNSERELYFELVANDKITLDNINDALIKIEKNIYGKCECCGVVIPIKRLKAIPWTRYCIQCQTEAENPKR
jgi:DnaK suppressor protein